jgi:hypothetical protein
MLDGKVRLDWLRLHHPLSPEAEARGSSPLDRS